MIQCPVCFDLIDKHSKEGCLECMEKAIDGMKELKLQLADILEEELKEGSSDG